MPTEVITAASSPASRASAAISPGRLIPISHTRKSSPGPALSIVSGTPSSLLWLLSACVPRIPPAVRAAWIMRTVVVFPFEPVTPTTRSPGRARR